MENYRKVWDDSKSVYLNKPLHNWASNYCDALRYMCLSIHKAGHRGLSSEEFERKKAEALYGNQDLPRFFRNTNYDRYS